MSEQTPEQTPVSEETATEEVPAGPSLMGITPPNPAPRNAPQTGTESATITPESGTPSDILEHVNNCHAEAMEVLNRIWQHLTGQ